MVSEACQKLAYSFLTDSEASKSLLEEMRLVYHKYERCFSEKFESHTVQRIHMRQFVFEEFGLVSKRFAQIQLR